LYPRLLYFAAVLSLLLCIVACVAWVRSYYVHDYFPLLLHGSGTQFQSVGGCLIVEEAKVPSQPQLFVRMRVDVAGFGPPDNPALGPQIRSLLTNPTATFISAPRITLAAPAPSNYFALRHERATVSMVNATGTLSLQVFLIPYWIIVVALLIGPSTALALRRRNRKRTMDGLCENCGYDLRATPNRCPECGAVPLPVTKFRDRSAIVPIQK